MGLFDFLKKKKPPEETFRLGPDQEGIKACISYFISSDGVPRVDIEIADYEDATIDKISILLLSINMHETYVETLEMIKEGLVKEGREDVFVRIGAQIATAAMVREYTRSIEEGAGEEKTGEDPCINPSDVL